MDRARRLAPAPGESTMKRIQEAGMMSFWRAGMPAPAGTPGDTVHFAESQNRTPVAIKDIDFRRGADGAGRVVVDLPSNQVGVDIKQQGQSLVVEFPRTTLPDSLRRRLDVTDFGTP